jgi:hypothetical protein
MGLVATPQTASNSGLNIYGSGNDLANAMAKY